MVIQEVLRSRMIRYPLCLRCKGESYQENIGNAIFDGDKEEIDIHLFKILYLVNYSMIILLGYI